MGSQPCKRSNHLTKRQIWNTSHCFLCHFIQTCFCGIRSFFFLNIHSRWPHQKIAVSSRCHQDSFPVCSRYLKDRMVYGCARFFVQQIILSLPWCNTDLFFTDHIVKNIRINTRCIYHTTGLICFLSGMDPISTFRLFYLLHRRIKIKFCSVLTGIFRKSQIQFKRTHDTTGRCIQCSIYFFGKIRFHPAYFFAGKNLKSFYPIFFTLFFQFFQAFHFIFCKT